MKCFGSVIAARVIKRILAKKVDTISRQYKAYRFRRTVNDLVKNKKARIVQRLLRKVIHRNQVEFGRKYQRQILIIQGGFRMFKARKQLKRLRMAQASSATGNLRSYRDYQNGLIAQVARNQGSRKTDRVNRLLQDNKHLMQNERIILPDSRADSSSFAATYKATSKVFKKPLRPNCVNAHQGTGFNSILKMLDNGRQKSFNPVLKATSTNILVEQERQNLQRREKTL